MIEYNYKVINHLNRSQGWYFSEGCGLWSDDQGTILCTGGHFWFAIHPSQILAEMD